MTLTRAADCPGLEARARQSLGVSSDAIHEMVAGAVERHDIRGARLIDVGCGRGALRVRLGHRFAEYVGMDAVSYGEFPAGAAFLEVDLDSERWPDVCGRAALVAAVETIEHLENPWAFIRKLAQLAEPGGWVIVTTPNQLSVLSLLTLMTKRRYSAFQDAHYPAHRTALLETDLQRMFEHAALSVEEIGYSREGRLPLSGWHYPETLARRWPRGLSDNVMVIGRKPVAADVHAA
jgi:2-polyprenyl-3-methyl-5-hydroxy-6-metoxy-1,4-benzoquinol methylase